MPEVAVVDGVALVGELRRELGPDGHDALVGAVHLVAGEEIDVGAERREVGQAVRGVGDAVDGGDGADAPRARGDGGDVVDLGDDVGGMREGDEPDLLVEDGIEGVERQAGGVAVDAPLADLDAVAREAAPVAGVGLVVLVGDDDGVAGLQPAGEGVAEDVGVGRGRGAEVDPVGGDVESGGDADVGVVHRGLALRRRRGSHRRAGPWCACRSGSRRSMTCRAM